MPGDYVRLSSVNAAGEQVDRAARMRIGVLYAVLVVCVVAVVTLVLDHGSGEQHRPAIAGGYDVATANACLGPAHPFPPGAPLPSTAPAQPAAPAASFNLVQSGQYVNLANPAGTLGARLTLHAASGHDTYRMSGSVDCVDGRHAVLRAAVRPAAPTTITGSLAGTPLSARLDRDPPPPGSPAIVTVGSLAGTYTVSPRSTCLGGTFVLSGSGVRYRVSASGTALGVLRYVRDSGALGGDVACLRGGSVRLRASVSGTTLNNVKVIPLQEAHPVAASASAAPVLTTVSGLPPAGETFTAVRTRSFDRLVAAFFIAVAIVMLFARLLGLAFQAVGQPRVMGEVIAGIVLGPTGLGALSPRLESQLFGSDILTTFGIAANLGLIFYMFLVGLEIDTSALRGRVAQVAVISNTSVAVPMLLGMGAAIPLYPILAAPTKFAAFALFLGVSMSVTAFPVLARILSERRLINRPLGTLALACGATDDVIAWFLIALATTIAVAGTSTEVARTIGEAVAFVLAMALVARPIIGRVSKVFDESGRVPPGWVAIIFAGVLISAFVTQLIGIAVIFGGFVMGAIMPRNAGLTEDVTRRVEDFVVTLLLPLFFAYTGLRLNIGALDRPVLWGIAAVLLAIAIVGKFGGAALAARVSGLDWRSSALVGTLMNTRGLTELVVLNLALQAGVISSALFTMLVVMALVTTLMTGPLLRLIDPRNTFGAPVEEELEAPREVSPAVPERAILVAAQTDAAMTALRDLAEPLARSEPPRELILVRLIPPPRAAGVRGGLQTEHTLVAAARDQLGQVRDDLRAGGVFVRPVAFASSSPGEDLARLAESEDVDLVLVEGHRPLIGQPIPLADVRPVLQRAPCDVGVLVSSGGRLKLDAQASVVVPFGGAEHDWSALELGAWIASAAGSTLRLLGAVADGDSADAVERRLADAALLVRGFAGIEPGTVLVGGRGRPGVLPVARTATLLVIGLSDRWQHDGLGETRSQIARSAGVPVLFVRRGTRPAALAPRDDFTRFTWSVAGLREPSRGAGVGPMPEGAVPGGSPPGTPET